MTVGELMQILLSAIQEGEIDTDATVYIVGTDGYPVIAEDLTLEANNEVTIR